MTTQSTVLIVHAIAAPVLFAGSARYFTRFGFTAPRPTAAVFTSLVIVVDFLLVAMVILRSLEMFSSVLGTWIPFALIFTAAWLTGQSITRRSRRRLQPT